MTDATERVLQDRLVSMGFDKYDNEHEVMDRLEEREQDMALAMKALREAEEQLGIADEELAISTNLLTLKGVGGWREAEAELQEVKGRFAQCSKNYEDLAVLYKATVAEVKRLGESMSIKNRTIEILEETVGAMMLFVEAYVDSAAMREEWEELCDGEGYWIKKQEERDATGTD